MGLISLTHGAARAHLRRAQLRYNKKRKDDMLMPLDLLYEFPQFIHRQPFSVSAGDFKRALVMRGSEFGLWPKPHHSPRDQGIEYSFSAKCVRLCDFVNSTEILPAIRTDLAAITLGLGEIGEIKVPGIWKMNVFLLDDENYLNQLRINIPKWKLEGKSELSDKRGVWDWIKYNIRSHAISYSKDKAKLRNEKERQTQKEFEEATRLFENDPSASNRLRLDEIKEKLELLYEEKVKGIIIRARARWHEYGERSTKYFLNLEKRNHVKKHIRKLLISGSITADPYQILSEQKRFNQNLYKTDDSVETSDSTESFLNSLNIPQLSEEQKQSCEGRITVEECRTVIGTFQNNKSPGNDGLPIKFYKCCWDLISEPFIDCVNESFDKEEMSNSQRQAVITLIERKEKTAH